jgi:hypothetical protein
MIEEVPCTPPSQDPIACPAMCPRAKGGTSPAGGTPPPGGGTSDMPGTTEWLSAGKQMRRAVRDTDFLGGDPFGEEGARAEQDAELGLSAWDWLQAVWIRPKFCSRFLRKLTAKLPAKTLPPTQPVRVTPLDSPAATTNKVWVSQNSCSAAKLGCLDQRYNPLVGKPGWKSLG